MRNLGNLFGRKWPQPDAEFVEVIRRHLDPVCAENGFALNGSSVGLDGHDPMTSILYEAVPEEFAGRFPRRWPEVERSYGSAGPTHCLDLWIELDHESGTIETNLEGYGVGRLAAEAGRPDLAAQLGETRTRRTMVGHAEALARALGAIFEAWAEDSHHGSTEPPD